MLRKFLQYIYHNRRILIALALLTPLGFYTRVYGGPGAEWVNNFFGGVLYVIFWSLLFSMLFFRTRPWIVALIVFLATCNLEFLQMWHPPFLEAIRANSIGGALLGRYFSWPDFVYYLLGFLISLDLVPLLLSSEKT
jgi:hypothetical protein